MFAILFGSVCPLDPADRLAVFFQAAAAEEARDELAGGVADDGAGAAEAEPAGEGAGGILAGGSDAALFGDGGEKLGFEEFHVVAGDVGPAGAELPAFVGLPFRYDQQS